MKSTDKIAVSQPTSASFQPVPTPIPRKVHQVWIGDKPIPQRFQRWMNSVRSMSPGHEYRLWTEHDVTAIQEDAICPELLDKRAHMGIRADLFRFEMMRQQGGIYWDVDFEIYRPVIPLIRDGYIHYGDELSGRPALGFFACPRDEPFLEFLLRRIKVTAKPTVEEWQAVVRTTGPEAFAKALNQWVLEWHYGIEVKDAAGQSVATDYPASRVRSLWRETIYPYYYWDHSWEQCSRERYPAAYAAHHWGGSWQ